MRPWAYQPRNYCNQTEIQSQIINQRQKNGTSNQFITFENQFVNRWENKID